MTPVKQIHISPPERPGPGDAPSGMSDGRGTAQAHLAAPHNLSSLSARQQTTPSAPRHLSHPHARMSPFRAKLPTTAEAPGVPTPSSSTIVEAVHGAKPAAQATTARPPRLINQLPSEIKIDLSHAPDATIENLSPEQLGKLTLALGLGELGATPEEVALQKQDVSLQMTFTHLDWTHFNLTYPAGACLQVTQLFKQMKDDDLFGDQTEAISRRMVELADITRFSVQEIALPPEAGGKTRLNFYFGGTGNMRDVKQDIDTIFGRVGPVCTAARELAGIFADILEKREGLYDINRLAGMSMGGGVAQVFASALQSKVQLERDPALVLLDPVLLNNAQGKHATKKGQNEYAFDKVRGVAITLDYADKPRKGVMNLMKGLGRFKSPGLVQLRLGLKHEDGGLERSLPAAAKMIRKMPLSKLPMLRRPLIKLEDRLLASAAPTPPSAVPPRAHAAGLGYHATPLQYQAAMGRFLTSS